MAHFRFRSPVQCTDPANKENPMRNITSILALLLAALLLAACTTGRSPDQQRENAKGAQDELKTETQR
jgi:outer membrane biogenesis lipoprotein LolB